MTCDSCCCGLLAHFCLPVSLFLCLDLWTACCVLMIHTVCVDVDSPTLFFPFTFASACLLLTLLLLCQFSYSLSWPCLFSSFHFPYFVSLFLLCVFSLHVCIGPFVTPRHFFVILLYFIYSLLVSYFCLQSPPSPTFHFSFISFFSSTSVIFFFQSVSLGHICPRFTLSGSSMCASLPFFYLSIASLHFSICLSIQLFNALSFCPSSVTQEKPPSCCMTFFTPSPSRSSWCPAAAVSPHWWPKLLACGTS